MSEEQCDSELPILQRHKREKKALQAEIQKLKHGVTKGDKKKKKDVTEKIATLEAELKAKHEQELAQEAGGDECAGQQSSGDSAAAGTVDDLCNQMAEAKTADERTDTNTDTNKQKKPSKAQKRREKKAAADVEREERIREQEIENLTSSRHLEAIKIAASLSHRGLQIHQIPSDGDCLYAAVVHQLEKRNVKNSVSNLRSEVAGHMRENAGDFMPFLSKDNGDFYTEEDYEKYCTDLESTPAWGGQLEIQSLSTVLKTPIEVVQSEGPPLVTGDQFKNLPIILTYYRHAYGLGEHYNSVEDKVDDEEDNFT